MINVGKIARLTLGLLLVIFGLNGITGFLGERLLPADAEAAIQMVENLSFPIPMLASLAVVTGAVLLLDLLIPVAVSVALVIILPVLVFHLMYFPRGSMFAFLGLVAAVVVIWDYRKGFRLILRRVRKAE